MLDAEAVVRHSAERAVLRLGGGRTTMKAGEIGDAVRAGWVAATLGVMDPGSLPELQAALADPYPPTRAAAARALGELGDRRAAETLIQALADPDWYVRVCAAAALALLDAAGALGALRRLRADEHPAVRKAAAAAMGRLC
jgi:HEAT repeat protein